MRCAHVARSDQEMVSRRNEGSFKAWQQQALTFIYIPFVFIQLGDHFTQSPAEPERSSYPCPSAVAQRCAICTGSASLWVEERLRGGRLQATRGRCRMHRCVAHRPRLHQRIYLPFKEAPGIPEGSNARLPSRQRCLLETVGPLLGSKHEPSTFMYLYRTLQTFWALLRRGSNHSSVKEILCVRMA